MIAEQTRFAMGHGSDVIDKSPVSWVSGAIYSEDEKHRYVLTRAWDINKGAVAFIGFNPSTATHLENDPTVRKCMGYVHRWGYGALVMLNVYSYRATDPQDIMRKRSYAGGTAFARGEGNRPEMLVEYLKTYKVRMVVAAWGSLHTEHASAVKVELTKRHVRLHALKVNSDGMAAHPLYLKGSLQAVPYNFVRGCCPHPQCKRTLISPAKCQACEQAIIGGEAL